MTHLAFRCLGFYLLDTSVLACTNFSWWRPPCCVYLRANPPTKRAPMLYQRALSASPATRSRSAHMLMPLLQCHRGSCRYFSLVVLIQYSDFTKYWLTTGNSDTSTKTHLTWMFVFARALVKQNLELLNTYLNKNLNFSWKTTTTRTNRQLSPGFLGKFRLLWSFPLGQVCHCAKPTSTRNGRGRFHVEMVAAHDEKGNRWDGEAMSVYLAWASPGRHQENKREKDAESLWEMHHGEIISNSLSWEYFPRRRKNQPEIWLVCLLVAPAQQLQPLNTVGCGCLWNQRASACRQGGG